MNVLSVEALSVRIGAAEILRDVSLTVAPGEIVALTGESGSGKSMTALATMGLLPRAAEASGEIRVGGARILHRPEAALCRMRGAEMGMVFQEPMTALNPVQTIGRQVSETVRLHKGASSAQAKELARAALDRVGLTEIPLDRYPHELSGGQRQRVVIAMATVLRPKLLIADEPTTALDVTTQARILDLLRGLARDEGMGLLLITHDLAVVHGIADRLAVMKAGEIVEAGPTADVFAARAHPYTAALFAASGHRASLTSRAADAPLLSVDGLDQSYALPRTSLFGARPRFPALKGVSLEIRAGERVGLVGESGSGKSTLTRAILGLETPDRGEIRLGGAAIVPGATLAETRADMQVVFQDPYGSFNPRHRVERLVAEPFHLMADPPRGAARQQAVADALEAVGLKPEDARRYIHAFSGGQRQRIAIARALITRPKFIIFDEAVSALDVRVRAQILDLIARLSDEYGLAYLFISHDLSVVRGITTRVLVLRRGEIVEEGPTEEVMGAPRHPYTQELIAAAPRLPEDQARTEESHAT
ncbi:peptide/nickel transport system ATP-binding protein [Roseivivax halotolerans]|uniref:Peptide/nickel transport system ATP-binding protein n=1 Tax=Roseivivax halotolerans TaxID=93684 RepID=A0A1I5YPJ3_9RHOB|nr:dipeptide ABC transporter ATP-binding protein [Roseivivax halotolerans]SFQ45857.1 peptide/nickel transport system ATP-binding protein [Roseivivax halotolerans]